MLRFFLIKPNPAAAGWWNDMWQYRQAINISSHTTTESNVYIITTVNIGSTTKAQTDGGDFRFVTQTGSPLSYYISAGVGTTNITFHVQFSSFPSGAQTIYVYYGNSSVTNGFSTADFATEASNYIIGSLSVEEAGGGPIAYWKFDEGSGTIAYNSNGINNEIFANGSSAPTWVSENQCISGRCLSFDGNDYLYATYNPIFDINQNGFTYTTWIKGNNFSNSYNMFMGHHLPYFNVNSSNKLHLSMSAAGSQRSVYGNTTLNTGTWYFVAATYDSSGYMKVYLNGKLDGTAGPYLTATNYTYNMFIGKWTNDNSYMFNGLIDEVKIYSYARTAAQIKLDYNSRGSSKGSSVNLGVQSNTIPSPSSSLVAYWKFNENIGTSVFDSSINKTNGYLAGTTKPTWTTGKYNSGIAFSGVNDSVVIPYRPNFRNAVTVSIWIKRTTGYNQLTDVMFLSPPNAWYFYDSYNSGTIRGDVYIDGIRRAGITVPVPFDGNWYHIAYTYDSATHFTKMYKNGILYSSVELTGLANYLIDSATGNISNIGLNNSGRGMILDEPRVYNRALTIDEIKLDYNQKSATTFGTSIQTIGNTTTNLDYCIPGDTSYCADPIAEWKMDEKTGTTIKDTSGNNNTGTFGTGNSSPTWTTGKIGAGLNFNATNSSYVSGPLDGTGLTDFSYNFWFKTNTVSGNAGILQWAPTLSSGSPMVYVNRSGSDINIYNSGAYSSSIPISPNTWYHFSSVYSAGTTTTTIYINGISKVTFGRQLTYYNNGTNFYLGNGYNGFFNGQIDHVKIYNYARTPAQIAYDYNRGEPVGWWKFDECQGNVAKDSSGIGNTGIISIGASGTQNSLGTCQVGTSAAWTNGATGKFNSSLSFDGNDDYVNIPNSTIFNLADNDYSINLWFKASTNMTDNPGMIIQRYTGGAPGAGYWIAIQSNKVYFENRADGGDHLSITSNSSYNDNLWHQVTITVNILLKTAKMYIDGNYVKSDTYTGNLLNNNANLTFGGQNTNYSFSGQIDDVRIYNYALTSEQIKTIYNGGSVSFN